MGCFSCLGRRHCGLLTPIFCRHRPPQPTCPRLLVTACAASPTSTARGPCSRLHATIREKLLAGRAAACASMLSSHEAGSDGYAAASAAFSAPGAQPALGVCVGGEGKGSAEAVSSTALGSYDWAEAGFVAPEALRSLAPFI